MLKDYQENKTLGQVAQCLANIEMLLLNNLPEDTECHSKSSSNPRKGKSRILSELKQVASSESSGAKTKASTRSRTRSNQVSIEKSASKSSVKKKVLRRSLPEVTAGTSSKEKPRQQQRNSLEKKNVKGESRLHVACNKGEVEKTRARAT